MENDNNKFRHFSPNGEEIKYFTEEEFNQDFIQFVEFINKYLEKARSDNEKGEESGFGISVMKKSNRLHYFTHPDVYSYDGGYIRLLDEKG